MKKLKLDIVFSQNDPQWKDVLLGNNTVKPYTIGGFGCKLTSFATYLKALGKETNPLVLNEAFKQTKQFPAGSGELDDSAVPVVYGDVTKYYASQKYDGAVPDSVIQKIRDLINSGYLVFAEVDFYPSTPNEDMHFVCIYGYGDNGEFYIADPWTGQKILLSTYGEPARVLYRIWSYDEKLAFEEATISIAQRLYEWLVGRATAIKEVATYLGFGDPDNTPSATIISTIGGYKSQITTLQTQKSEAEKQVQNKVEELARKQQSWDESAKQYEGRLSELNTTIKAKEATIGLRDTRIKELEGQVDDVSKKYGNLNIEYGKLEAENKKLRDNATANLGIKDAFAIIRRRLFPFFRG